MPVLLFHITAKIRHNPEIFPKLIFYLKHLLSRYILLPTIYHIQHINLNMLTQVDMLSKIMSYYRHILLHNQIILQKDKYIYLFYISYIYHNLLTKIWFYNPNILTDIITFNNMIHNLSTKYMFVYVLVNYHFNLF